MSPKLRSRLTPLGANVRRIMELRGIKHEVLALDAGIGINTLTHLLYRNPSVNTVQLVATALDVDLYELFLPRELDING